jgi:hypothetical protein
LEVDLCKPSAKRTGKILATNMILLFLILCSVKSEKTNVSPMVKNQVEYKTQITDLVPGTNYYWKVVGYPYGSNSMYTESIVHTFKIED